MTSSATSLRCVPLFSDLSDVALAMVARVAVRREYQPGQIIILGGISCESVYFLLSGEVLVFRSSEAGREQVLARLGPGQAFNTVPPFQHEGTNHATVRAMTSVQAYVIPAEAFRRMVEQCSEVALAILGDFAQRLHHLTRLAEDLSLRSVRGRLALFLLGRATGDSVTGKWTQQEIASEIGTVRDVVGRGLRAFADAGLLRIERHRIVLVDRGGLEAEARQ